MEEKKYPIVHTMALTNREIEKQFSGSASLKGLSRIRKTWLFFFFRKMPLFLFSVKLIYMEINRTKLQYHTQPVDSCGAVFGKKVAKLPHSEHPLKGDQSH